MSRLPDVDLGDGHSLWYTSWSPDRELNPQYAGISDCERFGAVIAHPRKDGSGDCWSSVTFRSETLARLVARGTYKSSDASWDVVSWEPLTLAPSLLCHCGDHGFIREGKWVCA